MTNTATGTVQLKPLRIFGLTIGGLLMLFSLGAWFPYLSSSLQHLGTSGSGPGATNQDLVGAFFGFWLLLWVPGLLLVLLATHRWMKRTIWTMIYLTAAMLLVSGITALIGVSTS